MNSVYLVIALYCLEDDYKNKQLYMFSTDAAVLDLTTFDAQFIESKDLECTDTEGQQYLISDLGESLEILRVKQYVHEKF